jgi:hypothetical protein
MASLSCIAGLAPAFGEGPTAIEPTASEPAAVFSGHQLLSETLSVMQRRPNVHAKVRQHLQLTSQELQGLGEYWQQGVGNQRRSRWQVQTQVAGKTANLLQVFDGRYVWTDRRLPGDRRVTRVDMVRMRRDLVTRQRPLALGEEEADPQHIAQRSRGGMTQLLAELLTRFEFSEPQQVRRERGMVWAVTGTWRPQELSRLWPAFAGEHPASETWPAQLPHHVHVEIGRDDLFPYTIEYRRPWDGQPGSDPTAAPQSVQTLARYEWFDVQFAAAMNPRLFNYSANNVDWVDETSRVLTELLPPAPEPAAVARRRSLIL